MGVEKYQKAVLDLLARSPVVSYASIARWVKSKANVKQYVKRLVHELVKKGKIQRLTKGYYTTSDDPSLLVFCFQPAYLGLQDALSIHDIWEQETIPVVVTTRKVRPGLRKIRGANVLIRRIQPKYYFGIEHHGEDRVVLPYSDLEKTFLDMLYFKQKMDVKVLAAFKKKMNLKKLKTYLPIYPKKTRSSVNKLLEKTHTAASKKARKRYAKGY